MSEAPEPRLGTPITAAAVAESLWMTLPRDYLLACGLPNDNVLRVRSYAGQVFRVTVTEEPKYLRDYGSCTARTKNGMCNRKLDAHGYCDRPSDHVELS